MASKALIFFVGMFAGWFAFALVATPSEQRFNEIAVGKFARAIAEIYAEAGPVWTDCHIADGETGGVFREVHCKHALATGELVTAWYPFTRTGNVEFFDFEVLPADRETS